MKIKCIMPDAVDFDLTYGKTYEVNRVDKRLAEPSYCIIDDVGDGSYMKEGEFEVVESRSKTYDLEDALEWSGEGIPKVGQYCQVYVKNNIIESWAKAKVLAVDHNVIVVRYKYPDRGYKYSGFDTKDVRPIKSQKQKEIEKIISLWEDGMPVEAFADKLYNQGYRKTK